MGLFSRFRRAATATPERFDAGDLGDGLLAARLEQGGDAPAACVLVVFSEGGQARRSGPGAAASGVRGPRETAWCFHPGPYTIDLTPYSAAPELGLRTRFVVDAGDPRVAQQRFDLYLLSEAPEVLSVAAFTGAIGHAVQGALEQGVLDLPPCTSFDEWNAFRASLNQLLYTRFGVTVEDCIPVDLGGSVDFAADLRARIQLAAAPVMHSEPEPDVGEPEPPLPVPTLEPILEPVSVAAPAPAPAPIQAAAAADDTHALRRLFLELPMLTGGLRQIALPAGQPWFLAHQGLLQRLALLGLDVNTMPALGWAAPGMPLPAGQQDRRARNSVLAAQTLDQAWALLARLQQLGAPPADLPELLDEADRLLSNLDHYLAQRRAVQASTLPQPQPAAAERREPSL